MSKMQWAAIALFIFMINPLGIVIMALISVVLPSIMAILGVICLCGLVYLVCTSDNWDDESYDTEDEDWDIERIERHVSDLDRQFPVEAAINEYAAGLISKDELVNIYLWEHPRE